MLDEFKGLIELLVGSVERKRAGVDLHAERQNRDPTPSKHDAIEYRMKKPPRPLALMARLPFRTATSVPLDHPNSPPVQRHSGFQVPKASGFQAFSLC
jgi:hypothetical protein